MTHHPLASRDWVLKHSVLEINGKQQRRSNCKTHRQRQMHYHTS